MLIGLNKEEMKESLKTLYRMAEKLGADITSLGERTVEDKTGEKRTVAEVICIYIYAVDRSAKFYCLVSIAGFV